MLTFLVFMLIIGFMCGICFVKKCHKKPRPGANESRSQLHYPVPVYEDVFSNFKDVK